MVSLPGEPGQKHMIGSKMVRTKRALYTNHL